MNLNSILIGSEDPARLADYYTKLLGAPVMNEGGYTTWVIGSGAITVGAHDQVKGRNTEPGRLIWNIETPDVKGDFARMQAAGATVVAEPYTMDMDGLPSEAWIATLSDPDGNYFQLTGPFDMG